MPKIPDCDRCHFCAHDYHLVCAPHPDGSDADTCPDFSPNPELEGKRFVDFVSLLQQSRENFTSSESFSNPFDLKPDQDLWEPEGVTYYAGELILQPQQRWTPQEQLDLLDTHPLFTGRCPLCEMPFPQNKNSSPVHWDCLCGWMDDTV